MERLAFYWLLFVLLCWPIAAPAQVGWPNYGNDAGGTRYSGAKQIDRSNVAQLQIAWTYRTGALQPETELKRKAAFEATPILVEDKLFLSTPYNHVLALNPQNGVMLWEYDPRVDLTHNYSEVSSRGVSAWRDPRRKPGQPCGLTIFLGTLDGRLIALDGQTGKPCPDFGVKGTVDLTREAATAAEWTGGYQVTSAPAIANGLVITGSSIADGWKVDTGRGIVRGFDARTGQLRWTWNPTPWAEDTHPRTGGGNAWSTLSVDPSEDLVFIPTGSSAPDYYGGLRKGDNKWANSVVALQASTGKFVWGFQVVPPRLVGLRCGLAAHALYLERWLPGAGDQYQNGPRVCAQPAHGRATASGGRAAGAAIEHAG